MKKKHWIPIYDDIFMDVKQQNDFHAGYVAVIGLPNVGKSTLFNKLLKFRLSITTPKPQTTRHRIIGIHSGDNFQIIFWDTPGLLEPNYKLHHAMVKSAQTAIDDSDLILFLVEAHERARKKDLETLKRVADSGKPIILAINKVDMVDKKTLLPLIEQYKSEYNFVDIIPISALKDSNVDVLEDILIQRLPISSPFYPTDYVTEHPERFFVSEIVREKIFENYGDEIPYSTAVIIDEFRERKGAKDFIKARIVVEKSSQKSIIIGKGGRALKNIGKQAREEIETFLDRPVYLELWVAVREKWRQKDIFLREFGYK